MAANLLNRIQTLLLYLVVLVACDIKTGGDSKKEGETADRTAFDAVSLRIVGVSTVPTGQCAIFTVYTLNEFDISVEVSAETAIQIEHDGLGEIYSDADCEVVLEEGALTISEDTDNKAFYYKSEEAESIRFTADSENLEEASIDVSITASAFLSFTEGSQYDFGSQQLFVSSEKVFTLNNVGTEAASSLELNHALDAPYSFKGGSFPGVGGDCGSTLEVDGSCQIVVEFEPTELGNAETTLSLKYQSSGSLQNIVIILKGEGSSAGNLDGSFGVSGKVSDAYGSSNDHGKAVTVLSEGAILLAGHTSTSTNGFDFFLSKYQSDGTIDSGFGSSGTVTVDFFSFTDHALALAVQSDGKILVGGYAYRSSTRHDFALVRFLVDGSLDTTFGSGGKVVLDIGSRSDYLYDLKILPDGSIIGVGESQIGTTVSAVMVKLMSNGALDSSFGSGGIVTASIGTSQSYARSVAVDSNGNLLVAGWASNIDHDFFVAKYLSNGNLDSTFGTAGVAFVGFGTGSDKAYSVAVDSSDRVVVVGSASVNFKNVLALARLDSGGNLDTTFGTSGKVTQEVGTHSDVLYRIQILSNGKMVVVGTTTSSGDSDFLIVRFLTSGVLDSGFGQAGSATTDFGSVADRAFGLAVQPDGSYVLAGDTFNGSNYDIAMSRYLD